MNTFLRSLGKTWFLFAGIGAVLAVVLCFVPLFNMIGYESAAFFGVLFGVAASFFSVPDRSVRGWLRQLARNELLLAAPFVILSANGLFVRNCDYAAGIAFWVAIPVMSIAFATTLRWFVESVVPGHRLPYLVMFILVLGSWVDLGLRLALEPPIVGFHWFLGYFSGSIYDEALRLPHAVVAYRRIHLLWIAAMVFAVEALRHTGRARRVLIAVAGGVALLSLGLFATRQSYGIDIDRAMIAEELGGVVETEHFIIYYPASSPHVDELDRLIDDHEFRYAELREYFGTDPVALHGKKVRSFVYPNRQRKGDLMGARRTLVAKIWLREMHIVWRFHGDHLLAHELAHVFTEPFGNGPLRLSARWLVAVNMGLVEGLATAADWYVDELDPHQASAALRRMNKAPDIERLVGASGFWTQSSGRAYTLMGSFVRYLVDTYGMPKFREAYGEGRFEEVYGKSPSALVSEWEAFVDAIPLDESELDRARYLYERKSIFQKVCARTVADLRIHAATQARRGQRLRALETFEAILAFDPDNVEYRLDFARFLRSLNEVDRAETVLEGLLERDLDAVHRAQVLAELGDLHWLREDWLAAKARFDECLSVGLPLGTERLLRVKSAALRGSASERELVREYLVVDHDEEIRLFFPARWLMQNPESPLASYLMGRRLFNAGDWSWALPLLRQAVEVEPGVLRDEAHHMLVQNLYFLGRLDEADEVLDAWKPSTRYYEDRVVEWRARVAWRRGAGATAGAVGSR